MTIVVAHRGVLYSDSLIQGDYTIGYPDPTKLHDAQDFALGGTGGDVQIRQYVSMMTHETDCLIGEKLPNLAKDADIMSSYEFFVVDKRMSDKSPTGRVWLYQSSNADYLYPMPVPFDQPWAIGGGRLAFNVLYAYLKKHPRRQADITKPFNLTRYCMIHTAELVPCCGGPILSVDWAKSVLPADSPAYPKEMGKKQ
jgi:hypothetical protein